MTDVQFSTPQRICGFKGWHVELAIFVDGKFWCEDVVGDSAEDAECLAWQRMDVLMEQSMRRARRA